MNYWSLVNLLIVLETSFGFTNANYKKCNLPKLPYVTHNEYYGVHLGGSWFILQIVSALGAVYEYEFPYDFPYDSPYNLLPIRFPVRYKSAPILNWTQFNFPGNYHFPLH
jgi:hypothetical protein